jgi:hypothetical protein
MEGCIMAKRVKSVSDLTLELVRKTRDRTWVINPVAKIIPNKKAVRNRKACRGKVVD